VLNINESPRLIRNDGGNKNPWITVDARMPNGKSPAVGARVVVETGGRRQFREIAMTQGYLSQFDPRAHFGLGKSARVDQIQVRWRNGKVTELKDVAANQFLKLVQPAQ